MIRRVTGTEYANIVCKFCGHGKVWHQNEGACFFGGTYADDCDCQAWDYGANVEEKL